MVGEKERPVTVAGPARTDGADYDAVAVASGRYDALRRRLDSDAAAAGQGQEQQGQRQRRPGDWLRSAF